MDEGLLNYMLSSAYKMHRNGLKQQPLEPIDDLTEEEAIALCNEILNVMIAHNLSYKNAYRISLALTTALAEGGIELYKMEP